MTDPNTCLNCETLIRQESFDLHILHCVRFLTKCACGKMVHAKDMIRHLEELHSNEVCVLCGDRFEGWERDLHFCKVKLTACQMCGLHLIPEQLEGHISICSMRTDQCVNCRKFILISEMNSHLLQNCMPCLYENRMIKVQPAKSGRKKSKKKDWVKVRYTLKQQETHFKPEDSDRQAAENLLEELIYSDLAEEEFDI